MRPADPVAMIGNPVDMRLHQSEKIRHNSERRPLKDGPAHPDPETLGRIVARHVGAGEWQRAVDVLRNAYRDVRAANEAACNDPDPPLSDLGISPQLCSILEKRGIVLASHVIRASDERLLLIRNLGAASVATIRAAVAKFANKSRKVA